MIRQAVILAGGLGTRLGAVTANLPKPLVPVGGRPFLEYILDNVAAQGFDDILLLTGFHGERVAELYDGKDWRGARIRCVREGEPLGTGGALKHAAAALQDCFILLNGDTLFDINLRFLASEAQSRPGIGVMGLRAASGDRYGTVEWDGDVIRSFAARGQDAYMNGGIYALRKSVIEHIGTVPASLESDVFPDLAAQDALRGRLFEGFFIDIGIPSALAEAQSSVPARARRPALFFDRDGVLNIDKGYVHKPEDFEWRDGAIEAIRLLNDKGWWVFVVTNQSGVARGYYDEAAVAHLHGWMNETLAQHGAHVHAFYHCPHYADGTVAGYRMACDCRKPAPGLMLRAMHDWPVATARSLVIGDKPSDVEAGARANLRGHLLEDDESLAAIVRQAVETDELRERTE